MLGHLNYLEFYREQARFSGSELFEAGGVLLIAGPTDFPFGSAAYRTDPGVAAGEVLDRARGFFGERGHGFTVHAHSELDADLHDAVVAAGGRQVTDAPEMLCLAPLAPVDAPAGLTVEAVDDEDGVVALRDVISEAYTVYGLPADEVRVLFPEPARWLAPHFHLVVARLGDATIGAAMTMLSHGIAGVYWVGVSAAARGQGVGAAVTRAVTNAGFDRGATLQSLQASSMGEPVYRRLGYETAYRYRGLLVLDPALSRPPPSP